MRWVENKAFPHPVLAPFPDIRAERDYPHKDFQMCCKFKVGAGNCPELTTHWRLSEESILALIEKGQAVYAAEVSCPKTYLRRLITSKEPTVSHTFGKGELHERTEISGYVVCRKGIPRHRSDNFHEEFGENAAFSLLQGDVVAIDKPQVFWWDLDFLKPIVSVFQLAEYDKVPTNSFDLLWDGDKITIRMRVKTKERFNRLRNMRGLDSFILNAVYMPALTETLRLMADGGGEYQNKKWYRAIEYKMREKDTRLEKDTDFYKLSQQLLEWPLGKMLDAGELHNES